MGCTTGGQIHEHDAVDDEITGVAIRFDETKIRLVSEMVGSSADSRTCGRAIGERLLAPDLAGIFILSDGLNVNGSELVAGITGVIGPHIPLTGGLAGDGSQFEETLVGANCAPRSRMVAGIGFYGNAIRIGHGSAGGWDVFGPWRTVTRSEGNVLFELDGEPALDLYERYLGDEAEGLPGSGLLFPLQIQNPDNADHRIVRTILAVNRDKRSLTFAGDVPEGWSAQLMRGNFDRLSRGAADAAVIVVISSLRANGPARRGRPDDRLREAIQLRGVDCFVAALLAMTAMPYDGDASRLRGEAMSQAASTGTPTTLSVLDRLFGLSKSGSTVRTCGR